MLPIRKVAGTRYIYMHYLLNQVAPLHLLEFHQTLLQCHLLVLLSSAQVLDLSCYCSPVLLEKRQLLNSGCYCHLEKNSTLMKSEWNRIFWLFLKLYTFMHHSIANIGCDSTCLAHSRIPVTSLGILGELRTVQVHKLVGLFTLKSPSLNWHSLMPCVVHSAA